jgi:hypothetical protein
MLQPLNTTQFLCIPFFFCSHEIKEWIMEDMWAIKRVPEGQGDVPAKVEIQSNSELQRVTLSQSRSPGSTCLQIDAQDKDDLRFGHFSYAWKYKEITFLAQKVSWSTKIGVTCHHRNKIIFQKLCTNVGHVLPRSNMSGQRFCRVYEVRCKYPIGSNMFD